METNYTLKKLIRGGTALLFLLAFMLTGTFSAEAQERGDNNTLRLKIDGPGVVGYTAPGDGNAGQITNPNPDEVLSSTIGTNFSNGATVYFYTEAALCWAFDDIVASINGDPAPVDPGNWTFLGQEYNWRFTMPTGGNGLAIVTVTFTENDPEILFAINRDAVEDTDGDGPIVIETGDLFYFCFDETQEITIDDIVGGVAPFTITYTVDDGTTVTTTTVGGIDLTSTHDLNLTPGTYTVTITEITDATGCSLDSPETWYTFGVEISEEPTMTLSFNGDLQEITADEAYEVCWDGDIDLTITGDDGETPWTIAGTIYGPGTFEVPFGGTGPSESYSWNVVDDNLAPGIYTFSFTLLEDAWGCQNTDPGQYNFTIEVLEEPTMALTFGGDLVEITENVAYEVCWDGTIGFTVEGVNGAPEWTLVGTIDGPDSFTDDLDFTGVSNTYTWDAADLDPGTYNISFTSLTDDKGCEKGEPGKHDFTIEVLPVPEIEFIWGDSGTSGTVIETGGVVTVCFDDDKGLYLATIVAGTPSFTFTYAVTPAGGTTVTGTASVYAVSDLVYSLQDFIDAEYFVEGTYEYFIEIISLIDYKGCEVPTPEVWYNFTLLFDTYTLTMAKEGQGTTDLALGDHTLICGEEIILTAFPATGWKFDGWDCETDDTKAGCEGQFGTAGNITTTFRMPSGDFTAIANFTQETYSLGLGIVGGDGGTTGPQIQVETQDATTPYVFTGPRSCQDIDPSKTFTFAETVTLEVITIDGWVFDQWVWCHEAGDPLESADFSYLGDNVYKLIMRQDRSLEAIFLEEFDLTVNVVGNGEFDFDYDAYDEDGTYAETTIFTVVDGNQVTLSATADSGWRFEAWTDADSTPIVDTNGEITLTITEDTEITVTFIEQVTLTVVVNPEGSGWVEADGSLYTDPITVDIGTDIDLLAVATPTYRFENWTGGATGTTENITVTVDGDMTVTANFVKMYQLDVDALSYYSSPTHDFETENSANAYNVTGAGYPEVYVDIDEGATVSITAIADQSPPGQTFNHWIKIVGGVTTTLHTAQIDFPIVGNTQLTAVFNPPPYAVFDPGYEIVWDDAGNHPIPDVEIDVNPTITFSQDIFGPDGQNLTNLGLGDLIQLQELTAADEFGTVTEVVKTVNRVGNNVTITPSADLKYNTVYRLIFDPEISFLFEGSYYSYEYRLDGDEEFPWPENALQPYRYIQFTTEEEPPLPLYVAYTLSPEPGCGTTSQTAPEEEECVVEICDEVVITFTNPIRFRELAAIPEIEQGENLNHKFKVEKRLVGESAWTNISGLFNALPGPDEFVTSSADAVYPGVQGPTEIRFEFLDGDGNVVEMDMNTEYRITTLPGSYGHGFIDLETGDILIGDDENIGFDPLVYSGVADHWPSSNAWTWTTTDIYEIMVDLNTNGAGDTYEVSETGNMYNTINIGGIGIVSNAFTFPASVTSSSFTVTASPKEGYRWLRWTDENNNQLYSLGADCEIMTTGTPPVNVVLPYSFTLDPDCWKPTVCEDEPITFKGQFAKKTYRIRALASPTARGSVSGASSFANGTTFTHGDEVTITATPNPGSKFVSWSVSPALPAGVEIVEITNPDVLDTESPVPATYQFVLVGEIPHNTLYTITANFAAFEPRIHVATDPEYLGYVNVTANFNVNPVDFPANVGEYIASPDETGLMFDWKQYPWNTQIELESIKDTDYCEYEFKGWRVWNWTAEEWDFFPNAADFMENPTDWFNITKNMFVKAVYEVREDLQVRFMAEDPLLGSVEVFFGEERWVNNAPDPENSEDYLFPLDQLMFSPGDEFTLFVYPEEDYYNYYWKAFGEDDEFTNIEFVKHWSFDDAPDRVEWKYEIGCYNANLLAVIMLKRFDVKVFVDGDNGELEIVEYMLPEDYEPEFEVQFTDTGLGFVEIDEDLHYEGVFAMYDNVKVVADVADTDEPEEFIRWEELNVHGTVIGVITDTNTLEFEVLRNRTWRAVFRDLTVEPTFDLFVTDNIDDYTVQFNINPAGLEYEEGTEVTVTAPESVPGYEFVEWYVMGIDAEEYDADDLEELSFTFDMPDNNVYLTAIYEKAEYTVNAVIRTHMRPHLASCLIIDPFLGGTVEDITPAGVEYTYGETLTFKATPNAGFRLINWMAGDIIECGTEIFAQGNGVLGYQINPFATSPIGVNDGTMTFNYVIPRELDTEIDIYAIFAEATIPYPFYQLTAQTAAVAGVQGPFLKPDTDGVAAVLTDVGTEKTATYAHGNVATTWILEDDIVDGYYFKEWQGVSQALGNEAITFMDDNKVVTAIFDLIEYELIVNRSNAYGQVLIADDVVYSNGPRTKKYDIEDNIIKVSARANFEDPTFTYSLQGFYYSDGITETPVIDADGTPQVFVEGEDEVGVESATFFWTPVVPSHIDGVDFEGEVRIYAKFARHLKQYTIDLETYLVGVGPNPTPAVHTILDVNGEGIIFDEFEFNDIAVITTAADQGYVFKHWKFKGGNIIVTQPTASFPVTQDATLVAVFRAIDYNLDVTANPVQGGNSFTDGPFNRYDHVVVELIPEEGYNFVDYTITEVGITNVVEDLDEDGGTIEFTWGYSDVNIVANYELKTYDVTVTANPELGGTVTGGGEYDHFENATVIATANTGYDFVNWTEDGDVVMDNGVPASENYTFMVDGPRDLVANFVLVDCEEPTEVEYYFTARTVYVTWDDVVGGEWRVTVNGDEYITADNFWSDNDVDPATPFTITVETVCSANGAIYSDPVEVVFSTLALGDVDGDGSVTVDDAFHMIDYINGEEFIVVIDTAADLLPDDDKDAHEGVNFFYDAADMNNDDKINIVDIVLIVSEATGVAKTSMNSADADMYLTPGMIQLDSDGTLAGVQFELYGSNLEMLELESMIPGFIVNWRITGDVLTAMFVGFDNNVIERGMTDLIRVANADDIVWGHTFAVNRVGDVVDVTTHEGTTSIFDPSGDDITLNAFPNPSQGQFTTDINTATASNVALRLYDLSGRQITIKQLEVNGFESVSWDEDLTPGMYILRMVATPVGQTGESVTREIRIMINK